MKKNVLQTLLATILVIALDQGSKWAMLHVVGIAQRPPIELAPFLRIVMVWNHGISFGMFSRPDLQAYAPFALIALALIVCALLLRLALKTPLAGERLAYGLVIGGALGNVIDRVRFGAVADFVYFHRGELGWPAFNLADSAICVGVALLLILMRTSPAKP